MPTTPQPIESAMATFVTDVIAASAVLDLISHSLPSETSLAVCYVIDHLRSEAERIDARLIEIEEGKTP